MNAHRQDMVNVEMTVDEVRDAIEKAIVAKYPFLDEKSGWELQDAHFHDRNLNDYRVATASVAGATYFFVKDIEVEDAPPVDKGCGCAEWLGAPTSGCATCPKNCLKPCR